MDSKENYQKRQEEVHLNTSRVSLTVSEYIKAEVERDRLCALPDDDERKYLGINT
ncbi:MAG: hypothetical protein AABX03_01515 [Nanoarchaeota archaeon]